MMKRKTKRALSMVLASSMMLSVSSYTAFAADYKDTVGHWSEKQVNLWSDYGVISGYDGLFRPDDSITRGEMAVIMDKVMKYQVKAENTFSDLDQNFYTDSVLKANQAGIMRGSDGAVRPKDKITREEASVLICQAFGIDPIETTTSKFNDSDKVSTWAAGYVNALLEKGYISGKGDNNFDPQGNITRGEAVTMFNNIVKGFYHEAGTYTENITGNVVVNTPETVLKDMSVTGDIFVTQGVADGNLTLENVKAPTVIVRGGGVNSVKITGNSEIGTVKVEKQDGDVRVVADGTAKVGNVYIKDGSKNSVLEGSMDKIQVDASNSTVRITNATVKELNVTKESAKVILDEKSIVDKLTIAETAANATVEINGTAKAVTVSAPNAAVTTGKNAKVDTLTVTEKATNAKLELNGTITTVETSAQATSINVAVEANITTIKALEKATDSKLSIAGKVGTILVDAPNVTIEVLKGGEVTTIESSATATGMIAKGEGKVSTIKVNGNNSKIDISGAKVIVGKDVTGTLVKGKEVKGGETVTTGSDDSVTKGEIENPNGNQFVNPNNPNDEWNDDEAMPQKAPEGLEGIAPTSVENNDGRITGTTERMEYALYNGSEPSNDAYIQCSEGETTGLKDGTYLVRFSKRGSYKVGNTAEVVIEKYDLKSIEVEGEFKKHTIDESLDFEGVTIWANYTGDNRVDITDKVKTGEPLDTGEVVEVTSTEGDTFEAAVDKLNDGKGGGAVNLVLTTKNLSGETITSDTFEVYILGSGAAITEFDVSNKTENYQIYDTDGTVLQNIKIELQEGSQIETSQATFTVEPGAIVSVNGEQQPISIDNKYTTNLASTLTIEVVSEDGTNNMTYTVDTTVYVAKIEYAVKWSELTINGISNTYLYTCNKSTNEILNETSSIFIWYDGYWDVTDIPAGGLEMPKLAYDTITGKQYFVAFGAYADILRGDLLGSENENGDYKPSNELEEYVFGGILD